MRTLTNFSWINAPIEAATLQERLPEAVHVAETREREVYGVNDADDISSWLKSYRDFVALCAPKQDATGQACLIIVSY